LRLPFLDSARIPRGDSLHKKGIRTARAPCPPRPRFPRRTSRRSRARATQWARVAGGDDPHAASSATVESILTVRTDAVDEVRVRVRTKLIRPKMLLFSGDDDDEFAKLDIEAFVDDEDEDEDEAGAGDDAKKSPVFGSPSGPDLDLSETSGRESRTGTGTGTGPANVPAATTPASGVSEASKSNSPEKARTARSARVVDFGSAQVGAKTRRRRVVFINPFADQSLCVRVLPMVPAATTTRGRDVRVAGGSGALDDILEAAEAHFLGEYPAHSGFFLEGGELASARRGVKAGGGFQSGRSDWTCLSPYSKIDLGALVFAPREVRPYAAHLCVRNNFTTLECATLRGDGDAVKVSVSKTKRTKKQFGNIVKERESYLQGLLESSSRAPSRKKRRASPPAVTDVAFRLPRVVGAGAGDGDGDGASSVDVLTRAIWVVNDGSAVARVGKPWIGAVECGGDGSVGGYTVSPCGAFELPPGASKRLTVVCHPEHARKSVNAPNTWTQLAMDVKSADGESARLVVQLSASARVAGGAYAAGELERRRAFRVLLFSVSLARFLEPRVGHDRRAGRRRVRREALFRFRSRRESVREREREEPERRQGTRGAFAGEGEADARAAPAGEGARGRRRREKKRRRAAFALGAAYRGRAAFGLASFGGSRGERLAVPGLGDAPRARARPEGGLRRGLGGVAVVDAAVAAAVAAGGLARRGGDGDGDGDGGAARVGASRLGGRAARGVAPAVARALPEGGQEARQGDQAAHADALLHPEAQEPDRGVGFQRRRERAWVARVRRANERVGVLGAAGGEEERFFSARGFLALRCLRFSRARGAFAVSAAARAVRLDDRRISDAEQKRDERVDVLVAGERDGAVRALLARRRAARAAGAAAVFGRRGGFARLGRLGASAEPRRFRRSRRLRRKKRFFRSAGAAAAHGGRRVARAPSAASGAAALEPTEARGGRRRESQLDARRVETRDSHGECESKLSWFRTGNRRGGFGVRFGFSVAPKRVRESFGFVHGFGRRRRRVDALAAGARGSRVRAAV
jgi:hypothetical protein